MQSDDQENQDQKDGALDAAEEERMIRIMQYCDGVLPAREAARVANEIAHDPEAARLAAEMSAGAKAAQSAWGSMDSGPVPFELARRVTQTARQPVRRPFRVDWKIAASLVVGIGLGMLGLMMAQHGVSGLHLAGADRDNTPLTTDHSDRSWEPALMVALGKDPETTRMTLGDSGAATAVSVARWFDTAAGLRCAEFARTSGSAVTGGGIACRKTDGGWDVIEQQR